MKISDLAGRVLITHAKKPETLFYGAAALGSLFRESDLHRLDCAYRELEQQGLVCDSGRDMRFFGDRKKLFRITDQGRALVQI